MVEEKSQRSERSPLNKFVELIRKIPDKKISRRRFFQIVGLGFGAVAVEQADQILTGGTFREVFIRCLLDSEYRAKVVQKIKDGDLLEEFQQQVADRTQEAEPVLLGDEVEVFEDWMQLFKRYQAYRLDSQQHWEKLILWAEIPSIFPMIAQLESDSQSRLRLYRDSKNTIPFGSIVLPGLQLDSYGRSNVWIPTTYTIVRSANGDILEFTDGASDDARHPRDGAINIGQEGEVHLLNADEVRQANTQEAQAHITIPFMIEINLNEDAIQVAKSVSEQLNNLNKSSSSFHSELSESLRYETFYLSIDGQVYLLAIYKNGESRSWEYTQRLSISQAVDLAIQYAQKLGGKEIKLVPTDPDHNDGVYYADGSEDWTERSATHKGGEELLRQAFYLTIT